jgi:aspartate/methionine/tyrosine aminotransferase
VLHAFLNSRKDLEANLPDFGTIVCPRLLRGSVEVLDRLLRQKYDTCITPGKYFEMPQHFRLGIGGDPAMTQAGLERLGLALDELQA